MHLKHVVIRLVGVPLLPQSAIYAQIMDNFYTKTMGTQTGALKGF